MGVAGGSGVAGGAGLAGGSGGTGGAASGQAAPALDLNDVSFLYPLPTWDARDDLLSLAAAGDQGVLLSRTVFETVVPTVVDQNHMGPADLYAAMRVVGVRVDPCFPADATASPGCLKQVRLVIQPIGQDQTTHELTTLDGAVHALYNLTDAQWTNLVGDLRALRASAGGATVGQPLGIHPVMAAQGLRGTYASALRTLILKYAGEATLDSMAFFQLLKFSTFWAFSAADRQGTGFQKRTIPLITAQLQNVEVGTSGSSTDPDNRTRSVRFAPGPSAPSLSKLPDLSIGLAEATSALRSAYLVDNPSSSFNPQTLDCGTCHVATRNLSYAERTRSIDTAGWPERFQDGRYNLSRTDAIGDDPRSLRSFGYFGTQSSIAGRTINESAVVAAAIAPGI